MKKIFSKIALLCAVVIMASCSGSKQIAYFQNIDNIDLSESKGLYDARIMPKDALTITVSASDPDAVKLFNLTVQPTMVGRQLSTGYGSLLTYLVDNNGDINFPKLGRLHVAGLTKRECENMIEEKIQPYLNENERPVVTVTMSSFRVTVIGEVNRPAVVPVTTEKMSVIEALSSAGDLSIYGKRQNIMLIREEMNGQKTAHRIDLTDANLINSPYYYVQQNDIIYVEPNTVKAKNSSIGQSTTIWFSFIGIVTSVASLLVNILRD